MKQQKEITIKIDVERFSRGYTLNEDNGCWEWHSTTTRGYGAFNRYPAHRISWMIHNDIDPYGMYVLHKCDNRKCVNPDHLYLGTQSDNMKDMWERQRRTNNIAIAKYNWDIVNEIRKLHATGSYTFDAIGKKYGMNRSMVYKIVNREIWKD